MCLINEIPCQHKIAYLCISRNWSTWSFNILSWQFGMSLCYVVPFEWKGISWFPFFRIKNGKVPMMYNILQVNLSIMTNGTLKDKQIRCQLFPRKPPPDEIYFIYLFYFYLFFQQRGWFQVQHTFRLKRKYHLQGFVSSMWFYWLIPNPTFVRDVQISNHVRSYRTNRNIKMEAKNL